MDKQVLYSYRLLHRQGNLVTFTETSNKIYKTYYEAYIQGFKVRENTEVADCGDYKIDIEILAHLPFSNHKVNDKIWIPGHDDRYQYLKQKLIDTLDQKRKPGQSFKEVAYKLLRDNIQLLVFRNEMLDVCAGILPPATNEEELRFCTHMGLESMLPELFY